MTPALEQKLFTKYPDLFEDRHLSTAETRIQHITVDDGWYDLVDAMCRELHAKSPKTRFLQIKEKFGKLRVYFRVSDDNASTIKHTYEEKSATICETCGKPGKIEWRDRQFVKAACRRHGGDSFNERIRKWLRNIR